MMFIPMVVNKRTNCLFLLSKSICMRGKNSLLSIVLFFLLQFSFAQRSQINWMADGNGYTKLKDGNIVKVDPKTEAESILIKKEQITASNGKALKPDSYSFSNDNSKLLLFVNTQKVWRYNTKGDYYILDIAANKLTQVGKARPALSLMFAKFSPDGKKVAYVSEHNLFVEDVATGSFKKITSDGSRKLINGTFDWAYEEEFGLRDGFRWSPDGSKIAFWQIDATKIRDYFMLNTTDSNYSKVIPVEYPKVGESPSPAKIGVANTSSGVIKWMQIDGNPQQHYLTRMDWTNSNELIIQQLDRKQQESKLIYCNATDGSSRTFWAENDEAWVDLNSPDIFGNLDGFSWINNKQDIIWISEKDSWRHIYKISKDGKTETLLTPGNYDIDAVKCIDEKNNYIYFTASQQCYTALFIQSKD
jgi:dipeptidyl-peptidase 4